MLFYIHWSRFLCYGKSTQPECLRIACMKKRYMICAHVKYYCIDQINEIEIGWKRGMQGKEVTTYWFWWGKPEVKEQLGNLDHANKWGRGEWYKLPGPRGLEGDPGPNYVTFVFVFVGGIITCQLYKLTLSGQAQFTLQLTVCLSSLG